MHYDHLTAFTLAVLPGWGIANWSLQSIDLTNLRSYQAADTRLGRNVSNGSDDDDDDDDNDDDDEYVNDALIRRRDNRSQRHARDGYDADDHNDNRICYCYLSR